MTVDVTPGMTLAQVIVLLREAQGDSVTIRISPDASLLLTANEFRALALAAERERIAIAVESSDGLRRQLASLFGVPLAIPVEEEATDPGTVTSIETQSPAESGEESAILRFDSLDALPSGPTTTTLAPEAETSSDKQGKASRGVSLGRLALLAGLLGLLGALCLAGYWYFFREATVTLALETQPVTSTIAFTVIRPDVDPATAPGAIPSEPVSFELSMTLDAPATGQETLGGTSAAGSLVLRNAGGTDVTIPSGTTIETFEGDVFVFPSDVTIPAASEGAPGEATAEIAAATPGPASNRESGMLSGQLPNGIYYSNRGTPVAGGTDVTLTVVTQEDLDALAARAEDALRSLASNSVLSGNRRVVPSTLTTTQLTTVFSEEVGAEAESVSVDATISFDALAFSTEGLDPAAEQALSAQTPPEHILDSETIVYQVPVETGEQNGTISMVSQVDGEARASMTNEQLDSLAESITGSSEEEATEVMLSNATVTGVSIEFSPDWMPHKLPDDADRIQVVLE